MKNLMPSKHKPVMTHCKLLLLSVCWVQQPFLAWSLSAWDRKPGSTGKDTAGRGSCFGHVSWFYLLSVTSCSFPSALNLHNDMFWEQLSQTHTFPHYPEVCPGKVSYESNEEWSLPFSLLCPSYILRLKFSEIILFTAQEKNPHTTEDPFLSIISLTTSFFILARIPEHWASPALWRQVPHLGLDSGRVLRCGLHSPLHHFLFYLNLAMSCHKSLLWFHALPSPSRQPPEFRLLYIFPLTPCAWHSLSPLSLFIPTLTNPSILGFPLNGL